MPFMWIHGESHDIYRETLRAIHAANIRAVCVEARPHKDFGRQQWWDDLTAILDEAKRLDMKVWILDDKHFPTGYANGGISRAPIERRRRSLCYQQVQASGGKTVRLNLNRLIHPPKNRAFIYNFMLYRSNEYKKPKNIGRDSLLSCTAYAKDAYFDLSDQVADGQLIWKAPQGTWTIEICSLSYDTGIRRNYINLIDKASCRIQIDEVYEPHYRHLKEYFGSTIAGFFSDEPQLANGDYTKNYNYLGTMQDLPYSDELAAMLEERLGSSWKNLLPLLWKNDYSDREIARVRYIYMDCVSRLVEADFSKQIGEWCNERGVEYIGHVIEDNNQHARTSTSLGHYFRGLKYQNMAGIDDIGGQVQPGGEDLEGRNFYRTRIDGEFFHYCLGKLGASLGALNPRMQGRAMCEVFGNYGWSEGVQMEKYLIDHFMVRGVNTFVPHAFSCKKYPDFDCPPHFYAHGHDPLFRHFGDLMLYTNRVCDLISGGKYFSPVAIVYHGEAEWCGKSMLMQKPARILQDNQIDFNFVPADVFSERAFYQTSIHGGVLSVNGRRHQVLVVPYAQFIPPALASGIRDIISSGGRIAFIDALPQGVSTGESLPDELDRCDVVALDGLLPYIEALGLREVSLSPENNRIRCIHYLSEQELFMFTNEGENTYSGFATIPNVGKVHEYDAWDNKVCTLEQSHIEGSLKVRLILEPKKSCIMFTGAVDENLISDRVRAAHCREELRHFTQSVCKSADYPHFGRHRQIDVLESYSLTDKRFSGFIRYESSFTKPIGQKVILEITEAYEGVEVFVNESSAGRQIVPSYLFDLSPYCVEGENFLAIEVATTLARERGKRKCAGPTGITGKIYLYSI